MFWLLLCVTAVIGTVYYRWKRRRLYEIDSKLGINAASYPIIGHGHLMKTSDAEGQVWFKTMGQYAIEKGGVGSFWLAHKLYVAVADPDTSEVILKSCMEKGYVTQFLRAVTGNGNIFAAVDIWRPRRKVMAPVFSMKNLNQFVKVFDQQSVIMTELLRPAAGAGDFSVWRYINTYTFDSVCETTLGIILNSQNNPDHNFLVAFDYGSSVLARRMVSPWMYPEWVFRRLPIYKELAIHIQNIHDFVDEIIQTKQQQLTANRKGNSEVGDDGIKTFLEMVMDSSERQDKKYSDLELREEVMVIVMAGTDTSAVGASFAAAMLARHPAVQENIHKELDSIYHDADRPVTVEDLPNLKYLEAVIKETLRLYPPVPLTAREVTSEVKLPSGTTLVPGVTVVLDIWATHRNPRYWGADADQFRPERFLQPLLHPAQFQPFSLPMRNCLGYNYAMMSMKILLANMLRRYRILPPSGLDDRQLQEPLKVTFDVMMRDMGNYLIGIEERCK